MGACGSKQGADDDHFSSLEHADGKPKPSSADCAVLPPSSSRYAVTVTSDAGGVGGRDGAVAPVEEETKRALNPADFLLSRLRDVTVVREPGQIAGQAFALEELSHCDVFLLDHSAAVTIDQCTDCRFFIGPCESSVFLRDCRGCSVVVAAQQLRLRDCHELQLLLYVSASQPVMEASDGVRLSSFSFSYPQLSAQFHAAGLHPFNSQWSNVHDFHQQQADDDGQRHWSFLPFGTGAAELGLKSLGSVTAGRVTAGEGDDVVPETWGQRTSDSRQPHALVLIPQGHSEQGKARGYRLIREMKGRIREGDIRLLRTCCSQVGEEKAHRLTGQAGLGRDNFIGLEWEGEDVRRVLAEAIERCQWTASEVVLTAEGSTREATDAFFEAVQV